MTYGLSLRAWASILWRALVATGILVALLTWPPVAEDLLGRIEPFWVALALFPLGLAIASVWIDMSMSDHRAAWRFRSAEKPVSLKRRFERSLVLIVYPQILILVLAFFRLTGTEGFRPVDLGPLFILISAIMASIGWVYTNYTGALKDRQSAAIDYLARMVSEDRHRIYARALKLFIAKAHPDGLDRLGSHTFTLDDIDRFTEAGETVVVDDRTLSFGDVCRYLIAYLEHLALSIRVGMYDYDIIQRQRRRRLILYYNTLFNLILSQSAATGTRFSRRYAYRRGNDMWENFIWLIDHMEDGSRINSQERAVRLIDPRRRAAPTSASAARLPAGAPMELDDV